MRERGVAHGFRAALKRLDGKRCLVTGGGSGIGREVALRFACEGAIIARSFQDVVVHGLSRGPATIELRADAQAPVYRLPVRDVLEGFHWRCDLTLPFGETVHDYLAEDSG